MEEFKLSNDIFDQIKDFNYKELTDEQELLIDKAIWKDGYIKNWDSENNQWKRSKSCDKNHENFPVVLKCLHNSQDISDFLRGIESNLFTCYQDNVIHCYGITKDPESNNFMMVMQCAENGNLRQRLNYSFNSMKWGEKLDILRRIAMGLENIHDKGLVHCNFHCEYSESIEAIDFTKLDLDENNQRKRKGRKFTNIQNINFFICVYYLLFISLSLLQHRIRDYKQLLVERNTKITKQN
ncbi:kinase-like domain-containing protein [Rhizophagus irregularis DAOM 181602=DAOM 197198]|nr:kinase-like domain-containing protein [Rhizophagus irregularis DAOM 181602=DAOM 197198]